MATVELVADTMPWQLPTPVTGASAAPLAGGALLVGGAGPDGVATPAILVVRPDGSAQAVGTLPAAASRAALVELDGVLELYGGASVSPFDLVQQWSAGPGLVVGHLTGARVGAAAAVLDGRVYVAGGYDGERLVRGIVAGTNPIHLVDVGSFAQGVEGGAMAAWRDSLWMIGGRGSVLDTGLPVETTLIQRFYPKTKVATVVGHLPTPVTGAAALVLGDQLFVVGGERGGTVVDDIWRIDRNGRATLAGHLPAGRSQAAVAVIDADTAWLLGGRTADGKASASVAVLTVQHQ